MKLAIGRKSVLMPLVFLGIFWAVAIWRYLATGKAFFLLNFGYIGCALALSVFLADVLPREKYGIVRRLSLLLIGCYLLGYVGFGLGENMQIEGFWLYLFSGVFAGATLHYLIAKIAGPLVFGRGWCGWACWTAMVLDLLPWRAPRRPKSEGWARLRYLHFAVVLAATAYIFFVLGLRGPVAERAIELRWLIVGNLAYYVFGIGLAAALKDNRAFCKYLCPIAVFMKPGARFSLLRIRIDESKCTDCKLCERSCPMQVPITASADGTGRLRSTECILCHSCAVACPSGAIGFSLGAGARRGRGA